MSKVVVGGTFNAFHKGHAKLLDTAITTAVFRNSALTVGVTSDDLAQSTRKVPVRPFEDRCRDVMEYIERSDMRPEFGPVLITRIDAFDDMPVMSEDDTLVVSEETAERGYDVLAQRGYICDVKIVEMVKDKSGEDIHSTKILTKG